MHRNIQALQREISQEPAYREYIWHQMAKETIRPCSSPIEDSYDEQDLSLVSWMDELGIIDSLEHGGKLNSFYYLKDNSAPDLCHHIYTSFSDESG